MKLEHNLATRMFENKLSELCWVRYDFIKRAPQSDSPCCGEESVHHGVSFILRWLNEDIPWVEIDMQVSNTTVETHLLLIHIWYDFT